jgi:hypothetical protein
VTEHEVFQILESTLGAASGPPAKNGDAIFFCPNCNHNSPHLVVNVRNSLYHCWICEFGGRGHQRCLSRLGYRKQSQMFSDQMVITSGEFTVDTIRSLFAKYGSFSNKNQYEVHIPETFEQLYFNRNSLDYRPGYNYLIKRGLTENDIMKYNIHYSVAKRAVLIPSYDDNFILNYYVLRYIDRKRYDNPAIPKLDFIFNEWLINWDEELYVVEGVFDAILSRRNSAVLLGSSLKRDYELFKEIVKHRTPVVLALDPDAYRKQCIIGELLVSNDVNVKIVDLRDDDKDISELGTEQFHSKEKIQFGLREVVKSKLEARRDTCQKLFM